MSVYGLAGDCSSFKVSLFISAFGLYPFRLLRLVLGYTRYMYVQLSKYRDTTRVRIVEKYYEIVPDGIDERSGLSKQHRVQKTRLIRHVGTARNQVEQDVLVTAANEQLRELSTQTDLLEFGRAQSLDTRQLLISGSYAYGLWEVVGKCYDQLGLPTDSLLKPLVLARIAYPKSKRLTAPFLAREFGMSVGLQTIYDFMDSLDTDQLMTRLLKRAEARTKAMAGTSIAVIFYDVTTLYFETDEDDEDMLDPKTGEVKLVGLRKKGYSKDHRPDQPQVVIGLSVDATGFPLSLQVYEGNTYEGDTLLDGVGDVATKLSLKPADVTIVADAGMLSDKNLNKLEKAGYRYIVGARLRSMTRQRTTAVVGWDYAGGQQPYDQVLKPSHDDCPNRRLIVTYSEKRAKRRKNNRERLVASLKKKLNRGVVIKKSKYISLSLANEAKLTGTLDIAKIDADARFDGLKGYVTNTGLSVGEVIHQYTELWHVERSFRMKKSDLRVRPIFHYSRKRIIGHLAICVCSLATMRELEQQLHTLGEPNKPSLNEALRLITEIRQYQLKAPGYTTTIWSELTPVQQRLLEL